jgi:hypothetical protein
MFVLDEGVCWDAGACHYAVFVVMQALVAIRLFVVMHSLLSVQ